MPADVTQDPRVRGIFGYDGRGGDQPRFTRVVGNIAYEIGIWEKQSSFYHQSKSCQNEISGNIHFQGPRAGINFVRASHHHHHLHRLHRHHCRSTRPH